MPTLRPFLVGERARHLLYGECVVIASEEGWLQVRAVSASWPSLIMRVSPDNLRHGSSVTIWVDDPDEGGRPMLSAEQRAELQLDPMMVHTYDARLLAQDVLRVDELEALFDLRWRADMRAIKRWQDAHPGKELTWPDHAEMVVWLMEQVGGSGGDPAA